MMAEDPFHCFGLLSRKKQNVAIQNKRNLHSLSFHTSNVSNPQQV